MILKEDDIFLTVVKVLQISNSMHTKLGGGGGGAARQPAGQPAAVPGSGVTTTTPPHPLAHGALAALRGARLCLCPLSRQSPHSQQNKILFEKISHLAICGSEMIYSVSGSGTKFEEFRIRIVPMLFKNIWKLLNNTP